MDVRQAELCKNCGCAPNPLQPPNRARGWQMYETEFCAAEKL